jgi:hypothetical protein
MQRALAATRKRHAHLLTQKQLDNQNSDGTSPVRDEAKLDDATRHTFPIATAGGSET